ncbi:hypothetical protein J2739_003480 [Variovorax soli]|uniref:Uncharacterized protein n=1 Tax=Variovorax soli TaxID=376815 RepID=A0ABU1NGW7_9BURK|nr:hypothetical protein [Variovorax soli]
MTLCFYTAKMACLPEKNQRRSVMHPLHPAACAPAQRSHLFLIPPPLPRRAPSLPTPAVDPRTQAARVIAITRRHWWP